MTRFRHAAAPSLSIRVILSVFFLAFGPVPAAAQVCAGTPSFATYRWQTNVGLELTDGGGGSASNVFGALGAGHGALFAFGRVSMQFGHDDVPGRGYGVGASGGADFGVAKEGRLHVCPVFSAERVFGPDADDAVRPGTVENGVVIPPRAGPLESDSTIISGGALLGYVWKDDGLKRFIPTLGLLVINQSTSFTLAGIADPEVSDTFFELRIGMGLVLNDQMALTPAVAIPMGTDLRGTTLQIVASLAF